MLDSDVAAFRQRLLEDLMPLIAAEVDARVQAAANQRAAEELEAAANELSGDDGMGIVMDWQLRARAAALASPAPAPHAEESS